MPEPAVSLIICTRNRCQALSVCLEHVGRLQTPPGGWELIVVDNGSTDATALVLARFAAGVHFPVTVVPEQLAGLGGARNTGLDRARGRVIAFTDDDCYVAPDFLLQVHRVFKENDVGYAGGRILLFDPTDDAVTTRPEDEGFLIPPYSFLPAGVVHGANMAVRRELVSAIGGFDARLGAGTTFHACEDVEYLARASWAGWRGGYFPGPLVFHHHGRKPGGDVAQLKKRYAYGRGAYFALFLLQRSTRPLYLKQWFWSLRAHLRKGRFGMLQRELRGAARFCLTHLFRPVKPPRFSGFAADDAPRRGSARTRAAQSRPTIAGRSN